MEQTYKLFESEFRLKRGTVIGEEWCKLLGKQFRRDGEVFQVRIPLKYLQDLAKDLEMTNCKAVPTPSVLGHDLQDSPALDEAAHHRYKSSCGQADLVVTRKTRLGSGGGGGCTKSSTADNARHGELEEDRAICDGNT